MDEMTDYIDDLSNFNVNNNKRPYSQHFEANIDMFGDKTTLTQIVFDVITLHPF